MGLMQILGRVDCGLRAVLYLSVQGPEKWCSITQIAKQQGVPKKFLEEIVHDLMRCGLIKSKRGSCRGYSLARPLEQISFYDVIEAIEGPQSTRVWTRKMSCEHSRVVGVRSPPSRRIVFESVRRGK